MANVLLVDDRPENLLALEGALEELGFNLVRATSGKSALKCCLDCDFAVILLDVDMPGLDGFDTAALVRGRERCRNTPIIFITAEGMTATHESQGYALGAVDYIMKPFDPEALRAKVRMLAEAFVKTRDLEEQLREATALQDKVNILLVDDNPENRLANAETLKELGEQVFTASSGMEALRLLLAVDFSVTILDVHMPNMGGFELAKTIKENDRLRDMPLVFLSATADAAEDIPRGYAVGAVDFVLEPYNPEVLRAKVRALVELRKRSTALERQLREIQRLNDELSRSETELRELNETLEQRVAERTEALVESELRFRSIFDSAADGIILVDLATRRFVMGNPAMCELLGCGSDVLRTLGVEDIHPPEDLAYVQECIQKVVSGEAVRSPDIPVKRRDGRVFYAEVTGGTMALGERDHLLGFFRDVTDRRQAEETQRETNQHLEETLSELKDTQRAMMQQERLRAMGEMASGIAHDFNNALAPVVGYSDMLLVRPEILDDRETALGYLETIATGARDASNVVARLREFYRKRAEDEVFLPCDLNSIVKQAISLSQPRWKDQALAEGRTIHVETDLGKIPVISGNESELREVLTNLIFNAVDAMPEGGVITVRTGMGEWGNGREGERENLPLPHSPTQIFLSVTDTGIGMDDETKRHCLDPFYSTKGVLGTGIGLGMVYGIVLRHEGKLEIESEVGKGTTMRITLPAGARGEGGTTEEVVAPIVRPLRVLVVDDEPGVRALLVAALEADKHRVETAENGREGLEKFHAERFDLVFTDRAMPEMNGDQLARAIKEIAPDKPIIMLTGFGDMMEVQEETPPGVDCVVKKPVTVNELRGAIFKVMYRNARL